MAGRGKKRKLPRSAFLNPQFNAAAKEFGAALISTGSIEHRGNKGFSREDHLRDFFRDRLPKDYAVAQGEVVDLSGQASPQLDLMFYNQNVDFALIAGNTEVLAAEALLASIEVKSRLTSAELEKSCAAAQKLRGLAPYDKALGGTNLGSQNRARVARYFHCLFAYETDLASENWLSRESARVRAECGTTHLIDIVYVLGRGLINVVNRMGMTENDEGRAITNFYFSVLNFIQRESGRRAETPYNRYFIHPRNSWIQIT